MSLSRKAYLVAPKTPLPWQLRMVSSTVNFVAILKVGEIYQQFIASGTTEASRVVKSLVIIFKFSQNHHVTLRNCFEARLAGLQNTKINVNIALNERSHLYLDNLKKFGDNFILVFLCFICRVIAWASNATNSRPMREKRFMLLARLFQRSVQTLSSLHLVLEVFCHFLLRLIKRCYFARCFTVLK